MADSLWVRAVAAYAGLVVVMAAVAAIAGGGGDEAIEALEPPEPRAAFPLETRSPQVVGGSNLRVLVDLRRPALGDLPATERGDPARDRAYVRSLGREARALRSALEARGVTFGEPVDYARVWSGFAATLSTVDMRAVQEAGLQVTPVRRFYPAASSDPPALSEPALPRGARATAVAVVDSQVDTGHPALRGRAREVFDAVGTPPLGGRRDRHGTQVAGVLARALPRGTELLAVRVAGVGPGGEAGAVEESGTTDHLLAGLERAVDPDGDGDTDDAVPVALVGVSAPHAGFADSPEAEAVAAAVDLDTVVVAAAGNQGPPAGFYGTVGSPAAAPAALAAGAATGPVAASASTLTVSGRAEPAVLSGELLGGPARAVRGALSARPGRGRIHVASGDPAAAATRAATARAAAVIVANPARPPAAVADAALPVVGLTGEAARRALVLARVGGDARLVHGKPRRAPREWSIAASSSRGLTYGLLPKPDVVEAGSAVAPVAGGGTAYVAGTSVAAARTAAEAALLRGARPELDARATAALLAQTAIRLPDWRLAGNARAYASPGALALGPGRAARLRLTNVSRRRLALTIRALAVARGGGLSRMRGPRRLALPARAARTIRLTLPRAAAPGDGTIEVRGGGAPLRVRFVVTPRRPPRPHVGAPRLVRRDGRLRGVRFVVGRVVESKRGRAVEPLGSLVLTLAGPADRELTPAGGARNLLPGEYAYSLSQDVLGGLPAGSYRFVVRARGPAGGAQVTRRSASFRLG